MTISPEMLAETLLGIDKVSKRQENAIFFRDAIVAIFDGLIIFRGDLNMIEAIPRLQTISAGLGLPVAIIERSAFKNFNKKKYKIGKHIGPGNFMKNSWNTEEGFDFGLKEKYNNYGIEKKFEEKPEEINTVVTHHSSVNRSHLSSGHTSVQHRVSHNNTSFYDDDDWDDMYNRAWLT